MINSFSGEYDFLSNFYPCIIEYDELEYRSVEAAYQAAKTKDPILRKVFIGLSAKEAKKLGKTIKLREDWNDVKLPIMEELVFKKFSNPTLAIQLKETYPHELIEGNYWKDTFWGVCDGIGKNHLGIILMNVRKKLLELDNK